MADIAVGGVSLMLLVLGLVEFAKKLGVSGNASMVLALLLGIIGATVYKVASMYPLIAPWVEVVVFGLAFGLAATGLYDLTKKNGA